MRSWGLERCSVWAGRPGRWVSTSAAVSTTAGALLLVLRYLQSLANLFQIDADHSGAVWWYSVGRWGNSVGRRDSTASVSATATSMSATTTAGLRLLTQQNLLDLLEQLLVDLLALGGLVAGADGLVGTPAQKATSTTAPDETTAATATRPVVVVPWWGFCDGASGQRQYGALRENKTTIIRIHSQKELRKQTTTISLQ